MTTSIFLDLIPCSPLKASQRFAGTYRFHLQVQRKNQARNWSKNKRSLSPAFTPVSCLTYSSALKMEAIYSSEVSADFQFNTLRYVPEDTILYYFNYEFK
jgi:hypothetical protein